MNPADAEDATQEILIQIVTRLGQFEGRSAFRTWAYAVATRHLLGVKRRHAPEITFDAFAEDLAEGLSAPVDAIPMRCMMLEEVRIGCTLALLQCLTPEQRLAYILGEIIELDHREAAEVLRVSPAAYRKQLSRARAGITNFMLGHCGLVEPRERVPLQPPRRTRHRARAGRPRAGRPSPGPARSHNGFRRCWPGSAGSRRRSAPRRSTARQARAGNRRTASRAGCACALDRFEAWLGPAVDRSLSEPAAQGTEPERAAPCA